MERVIPPPPLGQLSAEHFLSLADSRDNPKSTNHSRADIGLVESGLTRGDLPEDSHFNITLLYLICMCSADKMRRNDY